MSYMSMTIFTIYSFFYYCLYFLHHNLFAYVVCYMLVWAKAFKGNNSYELVVHVKSYCSGAPYLTPYKNIFVRCGLELTVSHNLHFRYGYRCCLFPFTDF